MVVFLCAAVQHGERPRCGRARRHGSATVASFRRKPGQGYSRRWKPAQPARTSAHHRALLPFAGDAGGRPACRSIRSEAAINQRACLCFSEAVTVLAVQNALLWAVSMAWTSAALVGCGRRALISCWRGPRLAMLTTRKRSRVLEVRGGGDLGGRAPCPARLLFIDWRSTRHCKPSS